MFIQNNQQLPGDVDTKQLAWKRAPIRSYFGSSSKAAPCLQIDDEFFWNSIDNHNRSCERYIGLMPHRLSEGRVKDLREAKKKNDKLILESGDLFVAEAKTKMNEWWLKKKVVSENVLCFVIK